MRVTKKMVSSISSGMEADCPQDSKELEAKQLATIDQTMAMMRIGKMGYLLLAGNVTRLAP